MQRELHPHDIVRRYGALGRAFAERMHIAPARHGANATERAPRSVLYQVAAARAQGLHIEPYQRGLECARFARRNLRIDDQIAPRDVDVVGERHGHGVAGRGDLARRALHGERAHPRAPAAGKHLHFVAERDYAGLDASEVAARRRGLRARDELHRKAQGC